MSYDLKIFTENIEPAAVNQIYNLLSQLSLISLLIYALRKKFRPYLSDTQSNRVFGC
jgi:hypothetical protein